jgi:hypothetical protein
VGVHMYVLRLRPLVEKVGGNGGGGRVSRDGLFKLRCDLSNCV